MRTDLINLENVPSHNVLATLLGERIYKCYLTIWENILSLSPDIERWDKGGRRGKYYHGYIIEKRAVSIDLFLISDMEFKQLTCDFHFTKRIFDKVLKQKLLFSKKGIEALDSCVRLHEIYSSGFFLEFRLNDDEDVLKDILRVINIVGNK